MAVRQNPKPQTVAIVAADAEFALNASEGARETVKAAGLTIVYDRRYPSATTDLVPVVRAMQFAGVDELMKKYQARAVVEGVDVLGYYMAPWGYAQLQVLEQAVAATCGRRT